jgi:hypothetical protein
VGRFYLLLASLNYSVYCQFGVPSFDRGFGCGEEISSFQYEAAYGDLLEGGSQVYISLLKHMCVLLVEQVF